MSFPGVLLVALGAGLIVAEFFLPTYGSLGLGGLIAFVFGALLVFNLDVSGLNVGPPLLAAGVFVFVLLLVCAAWLAIRARHHRVVTGVQGMIGASAEVVDARRVRYGGELWTARSLLPLQAGATVRIARIEGLTVWVEPQ